jgi:hypothetical protein
MSGFYKSIIISFFVGCMLSPAIPQQAPRKPVPAVKDSTKQQAQPDPEVQAAAVVDKFLQGVKLADLPEGKAMMVETQWITGDADNGQNFYTRPVYTDSKTLYEGMFDTDVPGVRGYKRLMEMDAVSQANTPLKIRFIAIAYQNKSSGEWKVLFTGTDDSVDIERQVSFFGSRLTDTQMSSQQENYLDYGNWLFRAGRIMEAKQALLQAQEASPFSADDPDGRIGGKYVPLFRLQIAVLLQVIDKITGT